MIGFVVAAFVASFALAFFLGANDLGNNFAMLVASRALSLQAACVLGASMDVLGSLVLGAHVAATVASGVVRLDSYDDAPQLLILGMATVLASTALWLMLSTYLKLPVSATHAIISALVGFSWIAKGIDSVQWKSLLSIAFSWIISPIAAGSIAIIIRLALRWLLIVGPGKSVERNKMYFTAQQSKISKTESTMVKKGNENENDNENENENENDPGEENQILRIQDDKIVEQEDTSAICENGLRSLPLIYGVTLAINATPVAWSLLPEDLPISRTLLSLLIGIIFAIAAAAYVRYFVVPHLKLSPDGNDMSDAAETTCKTEPSSSFGLALTAASSSNSVLESTVPLSHSITTAASSEWQSILKSNSQAKITKGAYCPLAESESESLDQDTDAFELEDLGKYQSKEIMSSKNTDEKSTDGIADGSPIQSTPASKEVNEDDDDVDAAAALLISNHGQLVADSANDRRTAMQDHDDDEEDDSEEINDEDVDRVLNSMMKTFETLDQMDISDDSLMHSINKKLRPVEPLFNWLQILTASIMTFVHGGNDVSNSISPLLLALAVWNASSSSTAGAISDENHTLTNGTMIGSATSIYGYASNLSVPLPILLFGAVGIVSGLFIFGSRVIETIGHKLSHGVTASRGFSIDLGASTTMLAASLAGIPVSMTHCKVGSIVAVSLIDGDKPNWALLLEILTSWIVTIPFSMGVAAVSFALVRAIFSI